MVGFICIKTNCIILFNFSYNLLEFNKNMLKLYVHVKKIYISIEILASYSQCIVSELVVKSDNQKYL